MPSKYFVLSGIVAVAVAVLSCPAAVVAMEQFDGEAPPPPRSMRGQAQDYLHEQYKAYVPEARRQQIHGLQQDLFAAPQNAFKGAKGHFQTGLTHLQSVRDTAAGYAHGAYERVVPQKYREQKASSQPKLRRSFGQRLKSLVPGPIRRRWDERFGDEAAFDGFYPKDAQYLRDADEYDDEDLEEASPPQRRSFGERLKSLVPEPIRNKWRKVFGKNKSPSEHVAHPAEVHDELENDEAMDDVDLMDELAAEEQAEAQGWPTRIRHRVQQFPGDIYDAGYRTAENVYNAMPQRVQQFPSDVYHAADSAAQNVYKIPQRVQQFPRDVFDAADHAAENAYYKMPERARERFPVSRYEERRHQEEVAEEEGEVPKQQGAARRKKKPNKRKQKRQAAQRYRRRRSH